MSDARGSEALGARAQIAMGVLRGSALLDLLLAVPFCDRDVWVDELLGFESPPPDIADLPRGAVPYLPCGVDEILTLVREVPLQTADQLVDLGSGLGRVAILAHLLCGTRAHGIEIQQPLVLRARAVCAELNLPLVTFAQQNAADAELDGSAFFLYAPCNGPMLTGVLRRLERVAQRRQIVVCTVGLEFHDVPWLQPRQISSSTIALYDSVTARTRTAVHVAGA